MTMYVKPTRSVEEFDALPLLLTPEEVSELTGYTVRGVQKLAAQGKLPAVKVGNKWRFNKAKLAEALGIDY